ncbi:Rad17 cell cycle checkpoint protein-domain-containing protein [Lasiosphaeria hispida]|uniref:Rad17 cell cycle checkpoint protein-domain-containing protein n=1 Tax=Lasiosphaeria hispida TaxID=260671 RepID=A0AAJ0HUI9_9PEZI|nr:Rad17 cell cycle checkpoint protein-domain-containing protein [Lasiosphaeria hispida]
MAPPAKRRKRAVIDDSDGDDNNDNDIDQQKNKNTLRRFLFSSPDSKPTATALNSSISIDSPEPPSPTRKRTTRATAAAAAAVAKPQQPPPFAPPSKAIRKAPTKSPSTSPYKRPSAARGGGQKKTKVEEKGRTADLLTLFTKQAQRSKAAATTAASGSNGNSNNESVFDDIISDPISEDDEVVLHKTAVASSIVGKAAHKRFKESSQADGTAGRGSTTLSLTGGQRFLKQQRPPGLGTVPTAVADDDSRPWSERFAPVNLDELVVHKKKVADVRKWLDDVIAGRMRQRLLVLKGAAGSGKTTTVQLLAKDMRCEVLEWRNPNSSFGAVQGYQSAASQFEEFLGRGGKFGQLDMEDDTTPPPTSYNGSATQAPGGRRIILIEEFPNTFMRSSTALTSFRSAILQFLAANTPTLSGFGPNSRSEPITPTVMIISETLLTTTSASADSFTAHRLLGPEILRHPGTGIIEFNAIAPSLLAKALDIIVQKEARKSGRRRTPGPLVLKRLGEIGDIRNAISSLEFLCVKGDDADWGSRVAFTKPKRGSKDVPSLTRGESDSLELVSQREATLGIFHAVGKVVYNKRGERPFPSGSLEAAAETLPDYMAHLSRPKRSEVSVDTLIDETGTDTHTFISALHENFALSCEQTGPYDPNSSLDYLNGCLEYLSESDLLCPSWDIFFGSGKNASSGGGYAGKDSGSHVLRQDEMAFQVAVRGLLFSLPSPVKRQTHPTGRGGDAFKMFYPAYLKLWRAKEELEGCVDLWATKMLKGEDGGPGPPPQQQGFTNGSAIFRKPSGEGGVEAWGAANGQRGSLNRSFKPGTQQDAGAQDAASAPVAPLLTLGSAGRQEMLLERLPYMAHIARRRRCTFGSMRIRDLDRIVSFQGIRNVGDTDDEGDDEDGGRILAGDGDSWATDKPTEEGSSREKRQRQARLGAILSKGGTKADQEDEGLEMAGLPMQSLVLSDDDIEDD